MSSMLLFACAVFPLLSFALPSLHTPSLLHRAPLRPRIISYYPDWAPPTSMDYSLFDVVIFAFALPDHNYQLAWDTEQAPALLSTVVSGAHTTSTRVMLSIGGWTGSRFFSEAVATSQTRDIFANNILDTYNSFNLDGIDIDWEYPGQVVQQGNSESATDAANMLLFLKVLKQKLPRGALLSAAVQDTPFVGPDGHPMKDVSPFSQMVDWVTLMNYDIYETRRPPGPNAALSDSCGDSSQHNQNAVGGYNAWTTAGFPPSKLVLGVPAYGYVVDSNAERLSERSPTRAYPEDGSGQILFRSLVDQGLLQQDSSGSFVGSGGFIREWDNCSATPYLRSESAGQVISYDDIESLGMKADWVKNMNMGGVNMFDVSGDTPQHHLTNALRANLSPSTTGWTTSYIATPSSSNAVVPSPSLSTIPSVSTVFSNLLSITDSTSSSASESQTSPVSLTSALPNGTLSQKLPTRNVGHATFPCFFRITTDRVRGKKTC